MLIEAVGKPLTYRWPDGEVRLEPGKPVALPDERARKLLQKAPSKVRMVPPPPAAPPSSAPSRSVPWLTAWREVKALTRGVILEDPRMPAIMTAIELCDAAFATDDWAAFQRASEAVRQALKGRK